MRIALDAMGGDFAPENIVKGALDAAPNLESTVLLVGIKSEIEKYIQGSVPKNIEIVEASEVIGMAEKPIEALRKKKDSSISVAVDLVQKGEANIFVSAGNTGACTAASLLKWRQMPGFHRPAIASVMPNYHGRFLLLDAGASPDVNPEQLVEFGIMGRAYASQIMGRKNPKVHLLNMGEEEGKGNAFSKQAYHLLSEFPWFAGNIESKDIFHQEVDVVVCDAFVGNIVLKCAEGVAEVIMKMIRDQIPTGPKKLLYAPMRSLFKPLRANMDYAEYGGSPLLGLNHLTIICHGRSSARAIENALYVGESAIKKNLMETLKTAIGESGIGEKTT